MPPPDSDHLQTDTLNENDGKRARTKAANREAILDAARHVFSTMGFEAATVRDIIRETDLASGTFYNYFKSKEEVFEALTDASIERFRPRLQAVRDTASGFAEYVTGAYRAYFRFIHDEFTAGSPEAQPRLKMHAIRMDTPGVQAVFEEIRADLKAAHARGELPDTDIGYFTAACIGLAREVGDRMVRRRPLDPDGAADFCTRMVLCLIAGRDKGSPRGG